MTRIGVLALQGDFEAHAKILRDLEVDVALVRRIAEAHGGRAGAANRPAGGARFWVRLPGEKS